MHSASHRGIAVHSAAHWGSMMASRSTVMSSRAASVGAAVMSSRSWHFHFLLTFFFLAYRECVKEV